MFTTLPAPTVHASEKQYWTDAEEKAGYVEKVMNDGSIGSTFHQGIMKVEGETAELHSQQETHRTITTSRHRTKNKQLLF